MNIRWLTAIIILSNICLNIAAQEANDINLLNEYKLLYIDLSNIKTWGYKSYFNNEYNRAGEHINKAQGSLAATKNPLHFAIHGEGFFKIRLENNEAGYTRSGEFHIDRNGNIVTSQGYFLYDNINLPETSMLESLIITGYGTIYVRIFDGRNNITEVSAGQLSTYNIPGEILKHYKDAIYIVSNDFEYNEKITTDNSILQGALEHSNFPLLPVILRMYYILTVINENYISNIEFKKELLKIQIKKTANNSLLEDILLSMIHDINDIHNLILGTEYETEISSTLSPETGIRRFNTDRATVKIIQRYNIQRFFDNRFDYLMSILPYLRNDH